MILGRARRVSLGRLEFCYCWFSINWKSPRCVWLCQIAESTLTLRDFYPIYTSPRRLKYRIKMGTYQAPVSPKTPTCKLSQYTDSQGSLIFYILCILEIRMLFVEKEKKRLRISKERRDFKMILQGLKSFYPVRKQIWQQICRWANKG